MIDFAKAVDGAIVTSLATGAGTRDASGAWTPALAPATITVLAIPDAGNAACS